MMIRTSSKEQVQDWLELARLSDEIGDNLPCRQAPDAYFATQQEGHLTVMAKKACEACPIKIPCGTYALKHNEIDGVWGGMTTTERIRIRRGRK